MNKIKKPCRCGHRAGSHRLVQRKIETISNRGLFSGMIIMTQGKTFKQKHGKCAKPGCGCTMFVENKEVVAQ